VHSIVIITRRELSGYFSSPLAYVFIVIFLALCGSMTFYLGGWLDRGRADLNSFFNWHPWLYLFLVPAIGMRLWAEERRTGTIEFLTTLPVTTTEAVVGKYLAAWLFIGTALFLTFPMWLTVNYLGNPDNGVIVAGYLGSWLLAGAMLAISTAISALTKNQVIAFVLSAAVCFLFLMSGVDIVQALFSSWAGDAVVDLVTNISLLTTFNAIVGGVIDIRHLILLGSLIGVSLFINVALVDLKKGA